MNNSRKKNLLVALALCVPVLCIALCIPLGIAFQRGYFGDPTQILSEAVASENADLVQVAISRGADVNATPESLGGLHPLEVAAFDGRADVVKLLIAAGADVNAGSITALDMAMTAPKRQRPELRQGYEETIRILKAAGAKSTKERLKERGTTQS
jgi:hypothetical protein